MESTWLILGLILIGAHTAETILGFGGTLIALAIGAHFIDLEQFMTTLVLLGIVQSVWLILRGYRHIAWRRLLTLILPAAALGTLAGVFLRDAAAQDQLRLILGVFVTGTALLELAFLVRGHAARRTLPQPVGAGLVAAGGIFHGLFASGGPLIVYFASRDLPSPPVFRVTLSVLWLVLNTGLALQLGNAGHLNRTALELTAFLLPAALVGIVIGEHLKVDERTFRLLTYLLLLVSGLSLLF